ncbi:MAG: helix-turn-helix domain-containing protein, partial [Oscillospiraceae bacterium]|nr:helix-turn-helix domain-containing protein [Oscillospiraceae bacterium]
EKLADLAGVSAGYLCHLERGTRRNPSIEVMDNIAIALDKTIMEVFFSGENNNLYKKYNNKK